MEEILASIRRIIADDDSGDSASRSGNPGLSPPTRAAPPPSEPVTRDEEIDSMLARLHGGPRDDRVLTDRMDEPAASARALDDRHEGAFERREHEPYAARMATERRGAREESGGLISAVTTAAVESNFNTLSQAVNARDGRTVEELVSELLRPMLKAWLDENLPGLVERLVRAEIERVSRGRG
jgi:uncharacterized protein